MGGMPRLLNKSERMSVSFIYVSFSKLNAWILSNNTSSMSTKLTFYTIIKLIIWMSSFFFTNQTIILFGIVFTFIRKF
jgi:hypothetical protein